MSSQITGSGLPPSGGTMTGPILEANGSAAAPSYSFSGETNTGWYRPSATFIEAAIGGARLFQITSGRVSIVQDAATLTLGASADVIIGRDAANTLALRSGVNAQTFRVYNTFTDALNYERVGVTWSSNVATLKTENAGTGSARSLVVALSAPVTNTGATYTVGAGDTYLIANATATQTLTLPAASSNTGRLIRVKTTAAFTVVSASSNVVPLAGGAAGTAILAATAGKWADLVSDGTNWVVMAGN